MYSNMEKAGAETQPEISPPNCVSGHSREAIAMPLHLRGGIFCCNLSFLRGHFFVCDLPKRA